MALDRMEVRRAIGAARKRIEAAEASRRNIDSDARDAAHKKWRDLVDQAQQARDALEEIEEEGRGCGDPKDLAFIEQMKEAHADLLICEDHPDRAPVLCDATGLAIFEGDQVYGDATYGPTILKEAVTITVPIVDGEAA